VGPDHQGCRHYTAVKLAGALSVLSVTGSTYIDDAHASVHPDVDPRQYVMVTISDTGAGTTPDVVAKVFDPFFTTKPSGKRTGLGFS
jgi:signal transduction histidine kinase